MNSFWIYHTFFLVHLIGKVTGCARSLPCQSGTKWNTKNLASFRTSNHFVLVHFSQALLPLLYFDSVALSNLYSFHILFRMDRICIYLLVSSLFYQSTYTYSNNIIYVISLKTILLCCGGVCLTVCVVHMLNSISYSVIVYMSVGVWTVLICEYEYSG